MGLMTACSVQAALVGTVDYYDPATYTRNILTGYEGVPYTAGRSVGFIYLTLF